MYRLVIRDEETDSSNAYLDLALYKDGDLVAEDNMYIQPLKKVERKPFKTFREFIEEVTSETGFSYTIDEEEGKQLASYVKEGKTPEEFLNDAAGEGKDDK